MARPETGFRVSWRRSERLDEAHPPERAGLATPCRRAAAGDTHLGAHADRVRAMVDHGRVAPLEVKAGPAPQGEPLPFETTTSGSGNEPLKVSVALTALDD